MNNDVFVGKYCLKNLFQLLLVIIFHIVSYTFSSLLMSISSIALIAVSILG